MATGRLRVSLSAVWSIGRWMIVILVPYILRAGDRRVSVYLRGSAAAGETRPWLSDIDVVAVVPGSSTRRLAERWSAICRHLPLGRLVSVAVWRAADMGAAARSTAFTYDASPNERPSSSALTPVLIRPGLYGPGVGWRLIAGSDSRPEGVTWGESERETVAWAEVQVWWRFAFRVLEDERPAYELEYFWLKMIAEHARIVLWREHSISFDSRAEVLESAVRFFPEDKVLRAALQAWKGGGHSRLSVDASEVLRWCLSAAKRIAESLGKGSTGPPTTVRLGHGTLTGIFPGANDLKITPLVDWHARVLPRPFDDALTVVRGDPTDPDFLVQCARDGDTGPYRAIQYGGLLLLPTTRYGRAIYRSIQCAVSDPVSFALLDGRQEAAFSDGPGWSAWDSARRAVGEHARWLDAGARPSLRTLGKLINAARAVAFAASFETSSIQLPLTRTDLSQYRLQHLDSIEDAVAVYTSGVVEGKPVSHQLVERLREELLCQPPYR